MQDVALGEGCIYHVVGGTQNLEDEYGYDGTFSSDGQSVWNISGTYAFPDGFPSGQVGLYCDMADTAYAGCSIYPNSGKVDMAGRFDNYKTDMPKGGSPPANAIDPSTNRLALTNDPRPVFLRGVTDGSSATFSFRLASDGDPGADLMSFLCGAQDDVNSNTVNLVHRGSMWLIDNTGTWIDPDATYSNQTLGTVGSTDVLWLRMTGGIGSPLTINRMVFNTGTPTETDWSSCTDVIDFEVYGQAGMMGFANGYHQDLQDLQYSSTPLVGDLTVADAGNPLTVNTTTGMASQTLASDSNGNQTFDGTQGYTYDAWNRLRTIARAYRDSGGTLHSGSAFTTMSYDGRGRRITKADASVITYQYYLDKDSVIEERYNTFAGIPIRQYVWGKRYIDELVQTSINSAPGSTHMNCDVNYWALQDANWNVLGIVDSDGVLKERYEYTPYGQRSVFYSPGVNDPYCMALAFGSQHVVTSSSVTEPYGLCEVGHQGLIHDEETGLVYDRNRMLNPPLGGFNQRELFGALYIDGPNLYQYVDSKPTILSDPSGNCSPGFVCGKGYRASDSDPGAVWIGDGYYSPTPPPGSPVARNPTLSQQCQNNANRGLQQRAAKSAAIPSSEYAQLAQVETKEPRFPAQNAVNAVPQLSSCAQDRI